MLLPALADAATGTWRASRVARALRLSSGEVSSVEAEAAAAEAAVVGEDLPAGCAGGGRLLEAKKDCAAGTIFCWMRCQPTTGLACGDAAQCYNTAAEPPVPVDPSKMCGSSCRPQCPAPQPGPTPHNVTAPPPPPGNQSGSPSPPWCHGLVDVDMGMQGFEWSHTECIMFLFKQLSLVRGTARATACVTD